MRPDMRPDDSAGNRHRLASLDLGNRPSLGAILIAQRKAQEQILDDGQAKARQVARASRPDARQKPQRSGEVFDGHDAIGRPFTGRS